jgi:hypothetical protein
MEESDNFQLKIQFGKSTSQNYNKALNKAKKFLNYLPIIDTNN